MNKRTITNQPIHIGNSIHIYFSGGATDAIHSPGIVKVEEGGNAEFVWRISNNIHRDEIYLITLKNDTIEIFQKGGILLVKEDRAVVNITDNLVQVNLANVTTGDTAYDYTLEVHSTGSVPHKSLASLFIFSKYQLCMLLFIWVQDVFHFIRLNIKKKIHFKWFFYKYSLRSFSPERM